MQTYITLHHKNKKLSFTIITRTITITEELNLKFKKNKPTRPLKYYENSQKHLLSYYQNREKIDIKQITQKKKQSRR